MSDSNNTDPLEGIDLSSLEGLEFPCDDHLSPEAAKLQAEEETKAKKAEANKKKASAQPKNPKDALALQKLQSVVGTLPSGIKVTGLDVASSQVRNAVTRLMRIVDPEGYEIYKTMKFKDVPQGARPEIQQARDAYLYLFKRFIQVTYRLSGV